MNCDQVFNRLTRGPFPAGESDDEGAKRHLAACHECRALAEALRPAVELFHESMSEEQAASLPAFHGEFDSSGEKRLMTAVQQAIARDRAESSSRCGANRDWTVRQPVVWQLAAAASLLVAVGAVVWAAAYTSSSPGEPQRDPLNPTPSAATFQPDEFGARLLLSLNLQPTCFSPVREPERQREPDSESRQAATLNMCCTGCHYASQHDRAPIRDVAVLARSCRACHSS